MGWSAYSSLPEDMEFITIGKQSAVKLKDLIAVLTRELADEDPEKEFIYAIEIHHDEIHLKWA